MRRTAAVGALALLATASAFAQGGAALYAQHCAACHQADGSGTVGLAPALKGEHWAKLGSDRSYLLTVLLKGVSGPIKVGTQNFVGAMPGFAEQLDDAAIAAVATHVRGLQGAPGDKPFAADEAKAQRAVPGGAPQTRQKRLQLLGG